MKQKTLFLVLLGWRAALFLLGSIADQFLTYKPSFPYADAILLNRDLPRWLVSWANFDGVHYLTIIEKGYFGTGLIQAFFPLFPMLVKIFSVIPIDPVLVGLFISNTALVGFILLFHHYISTKFSSSVANWSVASLLLFPTSFFLGAVYTESIFLLLVLASLVFAEQKRWWLASVAAGLASATRLVGIFLLPALCVELLQQQLSKSKQAPIDQLRKPSFYLTFFKQQYKSLITIAISSLGLIAYMIFLQLNFHDPLFFFHVQSEFGGGRQESIVLLPQVIWRYIKIFVSVRPLDLKFFAYVQELAMTLVAYLALLVSMHKVRWSWTLFAALAITLPTVTGTLSSMPRYILVTLPLFVLCGQYYSKKNHLWKIGLGISTLLLIYNTILFIQGYWVA